ncbi:hypothetical protein [Desulfurella sp.]|uniref:hypothetical protein n=1 Tax=Desulfurella sp. TaxID=1962857 RepID=UPI0025B94827|nr:hypothetical protein [Desulfurella sp.]
MGWFIKKTLVLCILIIFSFITLIPKVSYANYEQREKVDKVLNTANSFFENMQNKDFKSVWANLSSGSKDKIIESVYKNLLKSKIKTYSKSSIEEDFKSDGAIAQSFWSGYLKAFDPNMVLNESVWKKVKFDGNKAIIVIKYKKAQEPFDLKMYKENGSWKVGLIETFGI